MFRRKTRSPASRVGRRAAGASLGIEGLEGRALPSTITLASPAGMAYGTALSPTQLNATASVPGTFSYSPPAGTILTAGVHALTVTFTPADSVDYATVMATTTITVARSVPTVAVVGGGGIAGSPLPVTATVAGVVPGADATPSPSLEDVSPALTYYAGAAPRGTPLGGQPTAVGTYTVVASFPGSADYLSAASRPLTFTIARPATRVLLETSAGSTAYGQAVTLTATVSVAAPGTSTPTGTVTYYDGATTLGSASLDALGRAVLTIGTPGLGGHSITAVYSGDGHSAGGHSGTVSETVGPANTRIILVPNPVLKGKRIASLSLTAAVEPSAPGDGVPTGMVTFLVGKRPLGTAALVGGQAVLKVRPGDILSKPITVSYGGALGYRPAALAWPRLSTKSLTSLAHGSLGRLATGLSLGRSSTGGLPAREQHGGSHRRPLPGRLAHRP